MKIATFAILILSSALTVMAKAQTHALLHPLIRWEMSQINWIDTLADYELRHGDPRDSAAVYGKDNLFYWRVQTWLMDSIVKIPIHRPADCLFVLDLSAY